MYNLGVVIGFGFSRQYRLVQDAHDFHNLFLFARRKEMYFESLMRRFYSNAH